MVTGFNCTSKSMLSFSLLASVGPSSLGLAQEIEGERIENIVVTGNRSTGITEEKSMAPIDSIDSEEFMSQGDADINNLLRTMVPSFNVTTQPISDAGTLVRPANLRGLPPDSTLVLVNGKRRHRSAVITFLGQGISDGSQGPDISVIPAIALEKVEVLRDGASALYGSDAIAGVINFVLREDDSGAQVQAKLGQYYEGDGTLVQYSGNVGASLLENGFANFSFEYGESDETSRSVQRDDAAALIEGGNTNVGDPAQVWGKPAVKSDVKLFANFGQEITDAVEVYGFGNYATRKTRGGFYFRNPETRAGVFSNDDGQTLLVGDANPNNDLTCGTVAIGDPGSLDAISGGQTALSNECFSFREVFPGGFTPSFGGEVTDTAGLVGVRGELASGFRYDISGSRGVNNVDFFIDNTVNATLGPQSPTSFEPGGYQQEETQYNIDFAMPFTVDSVQYNFAFGAEQRTETYKIFEGEEASWAVGPYADQGFSIGSNGFPGFSPDVAGTFDRSNTAVYADIEANISDIVILGAAGRLEDFDGFGETSNGKIGANVSITDNIAIRSTYSTGFRAPTPGQANVTNTTTVFEGGRLINRGTIPPTNPIAQLKGGRELEPETSESYTFGTIFSSGGVVASIDYFNISVDDRIGQSGSQELTAEEAAALEAAGVAGARDLSSFRFYTNGFSTDTQGVDVVVNYPFAWSNVRSVATFAGNWTETKVASFEDGVLDEMRVKLLEEGLPQYRANAAFSNRFGGWLPLT